MEYDFDLASRRLAEEVKQSGKSLATIAAEMRARYADIDMTISDQALANYIGSSKPGSRNGKIRGMRLEYLACFADYFGVSVEYLSGKKEAARSTEFGISEAMALTGLSEAAIDTLSGDKLAPVKYADLVNIVVDYENERLEDTDCFTGTLGTAALLFNSHIFGMEQEAACPSETPKPGALFPFTAEYELSLLYAQRIGQAVSDALSSFSTGKYRMLRNTKHIRAALAQQYLEFERELAENMKGESE